MQTCSEKKQKKNITNIPSRPPAFNASLVSVTLSAAVYFTDTYVAHNVDSDTSNYLISFLMMCPWFQMAEDKSLFLIYDFWLILPAELTTDTGRFYQMYLDS